MKTLSILVFLFFISSCATKLSDSNLYWGDYSKTLYEYKKEPSEENMIKHKTELLRIIEKAKDLKIKSPPGTQAELGVMYAKTAELKKAKHFFLAELRVYPESKTLIAKLLKTLKTTKGKK